MVEECCKFVDQTPNRETKLKLIDTLRAVSEGKVGIRQELRSEHWLHLNCTLCSLLWTSKRFM